VTAYGGELTQQCYVANVRCHQSHLNAGKSRHPPPAQQPSGVPHHVGAGHLSEPRQRPLQHASLVVQEGRLVACPELILMLPLLLVLVASDHPTAGKTMVAAGLVDLLCRWPQACNSLCKLPTIGFSGNIESLLFCNNVSAYSPHQDLRSNWMGPILERLQ